MDWKYEHFAQEITLRAAPELVRAALRSFADTTLADWQVTDTADGFEATGTSAFHGAMARFQALPLSDASGAGDGRIGASGAAHRGE